MRRLLSVSMLYGLLGIVTQRWAADLPQSKDHPLMTRFPGSVITWSDQQSFASYRIAIGPVTGYRKIDNWRQVEDKLTRINYTLKGNRGLFEVYANYLHAVKNAGFGILAEGFEKTASPQGKVGQRGFLAMHNAANPLPPGSSRLDAQD